MVVHEIKWDGGKYSGMVNSKGIPHGLGRRVGLETIYEGEFSNGQRTGFARQIEQYYCYLGNFENAWKSGKGYQLHFMGEAKQGLFEKDKLKTPMDVNIA